MSSHLLPTSRRRGWTKLRVGGGGGGRGRRWGQGVDGFGLELALLAMLADGVVLFYISALKLSDFISVLESFSVPQKVHNF